MPDNNGQPVASGPGRFAWAGRDADPLRWIASFRVSPTARYGGLAWLSRIAPLALFLLGQGGGQAAPQGLQQTLAPQPAAQTQAPAGPATYVGSDTCQMCHEDIYKAFFQKNVHKVVQTDTKRGWETKACESCHGPASKHTESTSAADIFNPSKGKAVQTDKTCLKCHLNQPTHVGRIQSSHAHNQVSCTECHSIHGPQPTRRAMVTDKCTSCHTNVWGQFQRPYAHKLREGAMSCVDCHNPHGSVLARSMQTVLGNEPNCFRCHGDKRGPFTFEHAPVKFDACGTCHEPHGSANPRMLNRHEVRFQCLECHSNLANLTTKPSDVLGGVPPAIHDLRSPRYRNCTTCHQKIHGSQINRLLLR